MSQTDNQSEQWLPFMTVRQIADILQISEKNVRRLIKAGDLIAAQIGHQYRISAADFERYLRLRRRL